MLIKICVVQLQNPTGKNGWQIWRSVCQDLTTSSGRGAVLTHVGCGKAPRRKIKGLSSRLLGVEPNRQQREGSTKTERTWFQFHKNFSIRRKAHYRLSAENRKKQCCRTWHLAAGEKECS